MKLTLTRSFGEKFVSSRDITVKDVLKVITYQQFLIFDRVEYIDDVGLNVLKDRNGKTGFFKN